MTPARWLALLAVSASELIVGIVVRAGEGGAPKRPGEENESEGEENESEAEGNEPEGLPVLSPRKRSIPSDTIKTSRLTFCAGQPFIKLISDK
jgi:hypothetical protein